MRSRRSSLAAMYAIGLAVSLLGAQPRGAQGDAAQRLIAVTMGPSPMEENLRKLTDEIGGRMSGTAANRRGVQWAVEAFRSAGVDSVRTHTFTMPASWSEGDTRLEVLTPQRFSPLAVSIGWSPATPAGGLEALVVDVGEGITADLDRAAGRLEGAWLLVHSPVLRTAASSTAWSPT